MPSTPRRLPSGSWNCYAYLGKDAEGKRIQRSVTRPTKAEARAAAVELEMDPKNAPTELSSLTLAQAVRAYLNSNENIYSPSTNRSNQSYEKNHLGVLAHIPVSKITPAMMQEHINALSAKLSPKTVRNVYGLIESAIRYAMPKKQLDVKLPKKIKKEIVIPTPEEVRLVQEAAEAKKTISFRLPSCWHRSWVCAKARSAPSPLPMCRAEASTSIKASCSRPSGNGS